MYILQSQKYAHKKSRDVFPENGFTEFSLFLEKWAPGFELRFNIYIYLF